MKINIILVGDQACGKTRATNAIAEALKAELPDKEYEVTWTHKFRNGTITEAGTFNSRGETTHQQL